MLKLKAFIAYAGEALFALFGISLGTVHVTLSCIVLSLTALHLFLKIRRDFFTKRKNNHTDEKN